MITLEKFTPKEIYLIKVNNFDDLAKSTLNEWIYFFKNTELSKDFKVKGLTQVEQHETVLCLSKNSTVKTPMPDTKTKTRPFETCFIRLFWFYEPYIWS